jgi:nitroimidazol reductase NimA-like FMN-containing flavoprotein (pyridoxamine 5'-phosphate oxidase superfamily)
MTKAPQFFILTPEDCREILELNQLGRLAFRHGETIDIEPIGYAAKGNWLFMRSAYGSKLEALAHNPYVAFEVDEIKGPFDWRSVVAHGTIYMLPFDGSAVDRRQFERAVEALREVMPAALTERDPVPERQIVYGLHVDRVDGRMATSRALKKAPARARVTVKKAPNRRARDGS